MKIKIDKQVIQTLSNGTKRKIAHQTNTQSNQQLDQFDCNFPQTMSSIGHNIRNDLKIVWKPVQQLCTQPQYSSGIENLETPQYCNLALTQCLLILNWFVPRIFSEVFCERTVTNHQIYQFTVYINGIIVKLSINSKIPLKDGNILFADPLNNSIFPPLFQKTIAKVYSSYQQISENIVHLLQLWTGYSIQNFPPDQHSPQQFSQYLQDSFQNNNLAFFKTRNSIRLQNIGILSNKIYLITRLVKLNALSLIQFLQIDQNKTFRGRYSKTNQYWNGKNDIIDKNTINLDKNCKENYIGLKQILKISRQIIILHNTEKYSKNWLISQSQKQKHSFKLTLKQSQNSHIMISFHFNHIKCRNCVYLISNQTCQLISGSFKNNKQDNFIAAIINSNSSYVLFVYCQNQQSKPIGVNVTVYVQSGWCQINEINTNISMEQRAFLNFIGNLNIPCTYLSEQEDKKKNVIRVKNLQNEFGIGVIETFLQPEFGNKVVIQINKQLLLQCGIQPINCLSQKIIYEGPCNAILLFKLKGKFKTGDIFPPKDGIKVYLYSPDNVQKLVVN